MMSYTDIPALQGIYLEDSWVLDIAAAPSNLVFTLDLVLTNDHPAHHPSRLGEQYCYERGTLEFNRGQPVGVVIRWRPSDRRSLR